MENLSGSSAAHRIKSKFHGLTLSPAFISRLSTSYIIPILDLLLVSNPVIHFIVPLAQHILCLCNFLLLIFFVWDSPSLHLHLAKVLSLKVLLKGHLLSEVIPYSFLQSPRIESTSPSCVPHNNFMTLPWHDSWLIVCASISLLTSVISNIKMLPFLESNKCAITPSPHLKNKEVFPKPWTNLWMKEPQMGIYEKNLGSN